VYACVKRSSEFLEYLWMLWTEVCVGSEGGKKERVRCGGKEVFVGSEGLKERGKEGCCCAATQGEREGYI